MQTVCIITRIFVIKKYKKRYKISERGFQNKNL